MEGFTELAVPVRLGVVGEGAGGGGGGSHPSTKKGGVTTLATALGASLGEEELGGVLCSACGARATARRRTVVRSLPPTLCLALQRFVFDPRKGDRVKVADRLSIPLRLDVGGLVEAVDGGGGGQAADGPAAAPPAAGGGAYELVALMLHKGASARQGREPFQPRGQVARRDHLSENQVVQAP